MLKNVFLQDAVRGFGASGGRIRGHYSGEKVVWNWNVGALAGVYQQYVFSLHVSGVLKDPVESGEFDDARAHRVRVRGTENTFHDPHHMYSRLVSKALCENVSRVPRQHTPSFLG